MLDVVYLDDVQRRFRGVKQLADRAIAQAGDEAFFARPTPEANSIAILVKHLAGNLRSRWTEFLSTDGEKPDRDRDSEFAIGPDDSRAALLERWERGWQVLFATLSALTAEDLERTVTVRGEPHTVVEAIGRQLSHYSYHVGQIVLLARLAAGVDWRWLSVPPGKSGDPVFTTANPAYRRGAYRGPGEGGGADGDDR